MSIAREMCMFRKSPKIASSDCTITHFTIFGTKSNGGGGGKKKENAEKRTINCTGSSRIVRACVFTFADRLVNPRHVGARRDDEGPFFFLAPYKYV